VAACKQPQKQRYCVAGWFYYRKQYYKLETEVKKKNRADWESPLKRGKSSLDCSAIEEEEEEDDDDVLGHDFFCLV